ncbi:hypothetical protein AMTRI_Chr12g235750 [Amborella trichopoda]
MLDLHFWPIQFLRRVFNDLFLHLLSWFFVCPSSGSSSLPLPSISIFYTHLLVVGFTVYFETPSFWCSLGGARTPTCVLPAVGMMHLFVFEFIRLGIRDWSRISFLASCGL